MLFRQPPPLDPKHLEERAKLLATGLQNLALLLFGAVLLQPVLNASLTPPAWIRVFAILICGSAELSAVIILRYIRYTPAPRNPQS